MRTLVPRVVLLTLALAAGAAPRAASAETPAPFEIIDRAAEVEVIVRGAIAAKDAKVAVTRERLEIALDGSARRAKRSSEDATVRRVEIRGDDPRVLSIKLRHDHDRVTAIAGGVRFVQVGDAIHVTIPRKPAAAPAPVTAAAPTVAAPPAAPAAASATPPLPADADAIELEPAPRAGDEPETTAGATTATTPPAPAPAARLAQGGSGGGSSRWWMLLGGLALVGGGVAAATRRRRRAAPAADQLEIIATRSLGGKSRIVWLAAGDREIVVAVTPQQVRPLGQWRRGSRPSDLGASRGFGRVLDDAALDGGDGGIGAGDIVAARGSGEIRPRATTSSPAVSGLLRLREKVPTVNEDVATDDVDADAQWARDLIAATGGRR